MSRPIRALLMLAAVASLSPAQLFEGEFVQYNIHTEHNGMGCPVNERPDQNLVRTSSTVSLNIPSNISCPVLQYNNGRFMAQHPVGNMQGMLPVGNSSPGTVTITMPQGLSATVSLNGTMVDTEGGDLHRFRSSVNIESVNAEPCENSSASEEDTSSFPANFLQNPTATCPVTALKVVTNSIQRDNGRITEFDAELTSNGSLLLDHGAGARGGVYQIEATSVYHFTALEDSIDITDSMTDPDPLPLDEDGRVTIEADVELNSAEMGQVKLTAYIVHPAVGEIPVGEAISAPFAGGTRTVNVMIDTFEIPDEDFIVRADLLPSEEGVVGASLANDEVTIKVADDYMIDHIEVVQTVQDAANTVPLIAGKSTLIRVFPKRASMNGSTSNVPLQIEIGAPGSANYAAATKNGAGQFIAHTPNRARFGVHSYDFWVSGRRFEEGPLQIKATVNPEGDAPETDRTNNELTISVNMHRTRGITVKYIPVCVQPLIGDRVCASTGTVGSVSYASQVFPLADNAFRYSPLRTEPLFYPNADYRNSRTVTALLRRLERYDAATVAASGGMRSWDQLVAIIPGSQMRIGGRAAALWGSGQGRVAVIAEYSRGGDAATKLAHEVGHNLGLRHTVTSECGPGTPNRARDDRSDWPFATANIQEYGAKPRERNYVVGVPVDNPAVAFDLMSYCGNRWISPLHYQQLFNSGFHPVNNPGRAPQRFAEGEYSMVTGMVSRDGVSGELDPLYQLSGEAEVSVSDPNGDYCLAFTGDGGDPLGEHCFFVSFEDAELPGELDEQLFSQIVSIPNGTARVALRWIGAELAARNVSANSPAVTWITPTGGENWQGGQQQTLQWSGTDADGDSLLYSVFSSTGGGLWTPLVVDLEDTQLTLDPAVLDPGALQFRVIATDGFNTGEATVGPVNVTQNPAIQVAGTPVDLGRAMVGRSTAGAIVVENPGTGPLVIDAVNVDVETFVVDQLGLPLEIPAGASGQIPVQFIPDSEGAAQASVTIVSNASSQGELMVQLQGTGTDGEEPILALSDPVVSIVDVEEGSTGQGVLTILNESLADLEIEWSATGETFSVSGQETTFTIPALEQASLLVGFSPAESGVFEGVLTLTSNDPQQSEFEIPLFGAAIGAPEGTMPSFAAGSVVNAASYQAGPLAADMWATIFGNDLADDLVIFENVLPTALGGTRVTVTDSLGNEKAGKIQFVSPGSMNFVIPAGLADGPATVTVSNSSGLTGSVQIELGAIAPGLFSINADGQGPAAATWTRVDGEGAQTAGFTFGQGSPIPNTPLNLGPATDQLYLSLFGTGFRGQSAVSAKVGGIDVPVVGAVAQGQFDGLDQAVIGPLPRELEGRGEVAVELTFDGVAANIVTVEIE